jgi:type II secretory pathway pseudopilin PulG
MKQQRGFALLDTLLAVILMAVAAYGTYMVAKGFQTSSSLQTLEQRAITIAQNYMPFLQDTSMSSSSVLYAGSSNSRLSNDFLTSIGIPSTALVNSSQDSSGAIFSYVNTGAYYAPSSSSSSSSTEPAQSFLSFAQEIDDPTTGSSYLAIGFDLTGTQLNQVIQDMSNTFSVYYGDSGSNLNTLVTPGSTSSAPPVLTASSDNATVYSVFLLFPKMSGTPSLSMTTTAGSS